MSASNFKELSNHVGHKVEVVTYGKNGEVWNVAIECMTCNEVLLDFDNLDECPECGDSVEMEHHLIGDESYDICPNCEAVIR